MNRTWLPGLGLLLLLASAWGALAAPPVILAPLIWLGALWLPGAALFLGPRPARSPQVRRKTSLVISMAMSQRTPSHCPAISISVLAARVRRAGLKAFTCAVSVQAGKYGSRPCAKTRLSGPVK